MADNINTLFEKLQKIKEKELEFEKERAENARKEKEKEDKKIAEINKKSRKKTEDSLRALKD